MEINRRTLLKQMSLALGSMAVPNWVNAWSVSENQTANALLESLVNAIIPATETPGAKTIGAHMFIERMIKDCFDTKYQKAFEEGLKQFQEGSVKQFGKVFEQVPLAEQVDYLNQIHRNGSAEQKSLLQIVKRLTLQAYMTSEYFLTNHRNYSIAPGFYHGCTPIKS